MAPKKPTSHLRWRHAGTGLFLTEKEAKRLPKDKVVHERVPVAGKGEGRK